MSADRVLGLISEDFFRATIEVNDALCLIDGDDRVGGDGENPGEFRLRCSRRVLTIISRAELRTHVQVLGDEQHQRNSSNQRDLFPRSRFR